MKKFKMFLQLFIHVAFIALLVNLNLLHSQWVPTSGPGPGASIRSLAADGANVFAGSWGGPNGYFGGTFLTTNNGANWLARNSGLTDTAVFALAFIGTDLFAGTYLAGVFRSSNNGTNWIPVNSGLTNINIYSLIASGTNLFAGTGAGVFMSSNNGTNWSYKGLTGNIINAFGVIGSDIFAGTSGDGVYRSTNNGTNWIQINTGLTNTAIQSLAASGSNLYAGTFSGVFRTSNNGANWINTVGLEGATINALAVSGTNIFAGSSGGGIFLTTNGGTNWSSVGLGIPNTTINTLLVSGTYIFAGALSGRVYRRTLSEMITPITNISTEVPFDFNLSQNYPNPFNPVTNIKYQLPHAAYVSIKIYDQLGREATVLHAGNQHAGYYQVTVDGTNLASGIYFFRINAADPSAGTGQGFSKVIKMILIK